LTLTDAGLFADISASQHVRRYATESTTKSGGSNTLLYGALGAAAIGGGYYAFAGTKDPVAVAKDTAASVKSGAAVPSASAEKVFRGGGTL
jgi:cytochrome-b5 reductase